MRRSCVTLAVLAVALCLHPTSFADEGMYPITDLHGLDLRAKGLNLDVRDLYNPGGTSLIDAIVNIGGCTGSFVSGDGLILTNHHCAFGAVQAASTPERDYESGANEALRTPEPPYAPKVMYQPASSVGIQASEAGRSGTKPTP